jgi:hypothetical protein
MRVNCIIPFCRRTRGDRKGDPVTPDMEWICGEHWKSVPRQYRRVWGRIRRRWRRFGPEADAKPSDWRVWCRLKAVATERAVGL